MGSKLIIDGQAFTDEIVADSGRLELYHSIMGETLAIDNLSISLQESVRVLITADDELVCTADDELLALRGSTAEAPPFRSLEAAEYYFDDAWIGKYYATKQDKRGARYDRQFASAIKLLDRSRHKGGLYFRTAAADVISEIMGTVDYSVDDDLAAIEVHGYLPYDLRRNNLQKLLMATGGALSNMPDGTLRITSLTDIPAGTFDASRIYQGDMLQDNAPATAVQVTEHNYIEGDEEVVLFDGASLSTETIIFTEPVHDLSITGGTIEDSGVNFCTFTGGGSVILSGRKYQHVTRVITVGTEPTNSPDDVVKTITDNTLLTPNNATEVAERLYGYQAVAQILKAEVNFGTERPGDVVQVWHPDDRILVPATIKKMNIEIGARELRANTEFLVGYVPPSLIAGFENYIVLTGDGAWDVPPDVHKARVILCGGGDGGKSGANGANGSATNATGQAGLGGRAGDGGFGGKILEINIELTPEDSIAYSCAVGGMPNEIGDETTFGTLTSALGRVYPYGYTEPKSGLTFGLKGEPGLDGAQGNSYRNPPPGDMIVYYKGVIYETGANGSSPGWDPILGMYLWGGLGGGPAAGSNGYNGTSASRTNYQGNQVPSGGRGGAGGNAVDNDDAVDFGQGGPGGHGGGGGGAGMNYQHFSGGGPGGLGSDGGRGGPGLIIVYY